MRVYKTYIIKAEEGELEFSITKPTFEVLAIACNKLYDFQGKKDVINAGKVIFDACAVTGREEIEKNPEALLSACIELSDLLKVYEVELKKN